MGSQIGEIKKELRKYGWVLLRNGTKHYVYEKDGRTLLIPKGTKVFTRSYTRILRTISGRDTHKTEDQLNFDIES
jgi:predicted RNA binding protein YcfA (HicA-like mRNA interferase family)